MKLLMIVREARGILNAVDQDQEGAEPVEAGQAEEEPAQAEPRDASNACFAVLWRFPAPHLKAPITTQKELPQMSPASFLSVALKKSAET